MDILDRIKMVMKMNQLNAASFADKIGVQRSSVSHVLTGRNKPSLDFIEKMLNQFPKVNASWLISGTIQDPEKSIVYQEASAEEKELGSLSLSAEPKNERTQQLPKNIEQEEIKVGSKTEVSSKQELNLEKKIVKIITFYNDFSFDEYKPNSK